MNSGGSMISANGVIQSGQWYHVVVKRVSGDSKLFINGFVAASPSTKTDIQYWAQEVWIGKGNWDTTADMSILDLRWYPRALTDGEIDTLANEFNKDKYFIKE